MVGMCSGENQGLSTRALLQQGAARGLLVHAEVAAYSKRLSAYLGQTRARC